MLRGSRELLAQGLFWSGANSFLGKLPERDMLLVLNYHRIGNSDDDLFDHSVFSATGDQLNDQIAYLKRHVPLVTLDEALDFIDGANHRCPPRCRVLLTFDDGYLDNYQVAFPILRSHGVQGVFFLSTGIVGSAKVPWWDHIAYLVKTARTRKFTLRYPSELPVDIDNFGVTQSLQDILSLYKSPENTDSARFIGELQECCRGENVPATVRRFLDWDEAREMITGGMAIGSHTHSHHVLSQLEPDHQRWELVQSRELLRKELGIKVDSLAYPVGSETSFSQKTQHLAEQLGYRAAFSYHGGTNFRGKAHRYDVKRVGIGYQSRPRFRVQIAVCRFTGKCWP